MAKGEVTNNVRDASRVAIARVPYQPAIATSPKRRGFYGIPAFASLSSMSEDQGVVARRIRNVPTLGASVRHRGAHHKPMLDISAFLSPQPEFESLFKTFIPDVDSDGNRLSAVLDQAMELPDGTPQALLDSVEGGGMNSASYTSDLKSLAKTVTKISLDDLVLEPREVQRGFPFTLMEKCMTISIPVRSSPFIQEEILSGEFYFFLLYLHFGC